MFGKKNKISESPVLKEDVAVDTMPQDFYAGQDPVVKFKSVTQEVDFTPKKELPITSSEKKAFDKATVVGGKEEIHPANLLLNRKFLILGGVGLFILFVFGAGIYYWWSFKKAEEARRSPTPPVIVTVDNSQDNLITIPTTTPIEIVEPTTTLETLKPIEETALGFPSSLLPDSTDLDKDRLTDLAEETFFTDPAVPDSDSDSFPDGHEMFYLYNPAGKEPQKLIDAGSIREHANPNFDYKLYYPYNWAVGNVDTEGRIVVFSTLTGENIEVRAILKNDTESFPEWFGRVATGEKYTDLKEFANRFGVNGWQRGDELVYYFPTKEYVFTIIYHPEEITAINYRVITTMMAQSLRFESSDPILPPPGLSVTSTAPVASTTPVAPATTTDFTN